MYSWSIYQDAELATLLKEGNNFAYTEIYKRYNRLLFLHAFKRLNDEALSKDVVHDVFINLWLKKENLELNGSLRAYLYTSIRNRIFNLISRQKLESAYIAQFQKFSEASGVVTADYDVRYNQFMAIIEKEIEALPPRMKAVFRLSRDEQLSYKQIAEKLNISEETVKDHVKKALRVLKGKLGNLFMFLLM